MVKSENRKFRFVAETVDDSFHNAISPIVKLLQFISIMPVSNIKKDLPNLLEFKWTSFRIAYSFGVIAHGTFVAIMEFTKVNGEGITTKNICE